LFELPVWLAIFPGICGPVEAQRGEARFAIELHQSQRKPYFTKAKSLDKMGRSEMAGYRLYFLDAARHIAARDEFEADSDDSAIAIAWRRYNARSDFSSGFELWCGDRRLVPERDEGPANQTVA
jgi:hypothetical protein